MAEPVSEAPQGILRPPEYYRPVLLFVGNDDGHAFASRGFIDKIEGSGVVGFAIGDRQFCELMSFRGERGLSFGNIVPAGDPEKYAEAAGSVVRHAPEYIAMLDPPPTQEVCRMMRIMLCGCTLRMLVVALPSSAEPEFFARVDAIVSGIGLPRGRAVCILEKDVSARYRAA